MKTNDSTQRCITIVLTALTLFVSGSGAPFAMASPNCTLEPYADCTGANLSGADLSDLDLTGIVLHRAQLDGANFSNATLRGADLTEATLTGASWSHTTCPNGVVTTGTACGVAITASESGFSRIDSISYFFQYGFSRRDYSTTPAMIWYSFHPAEPVERLGANTGPTPLFVMLNGGPGAATSANLFANNTAPYALSAGENPIPEPGYTINVNRWTKLGHLLYIDAPLTGFSYNLGPADLEENYFTRIREAARGNFNPFIDAAQILRVVLRFLDSHEEFRDSPVIFVGESYGGTRVSTMLNLLLFYSRYDSHSAFDSRYMNLFRDHGLVGQIKQHLKAQGKAIFPRVDANAAAAIVAEQFGRQVLIQPQLTAHQTAVQGNMYWDQNSVMNTVFEFHRYRKICDYTWEAAKTVGDATLCRVIGRSACVTQVFSSICDFDAYKWDKQHHWSDDLEASAASVLTQPGKLNAVLGFDTNTLRDLKPGRRTDLANATAYQAFISPAELEKLKAWIKKHLLDNDLQRILDSQEYITKQMELMPRGESLESEFGPLGALDGYFSSTNYQVYLLFAGSPEVLKYGINQDTSEIYGNFFLENVRYVDSFLTDAERDLVIYSPALPVALKKHVRTGVKTIEVTRGKGEPTEDKPNNHLGTFTIKYNKGPEVKIFYPRYFHSGHAVGTSQPKELRDDIANWLDCLATNTCF